MNQINKSEKICVIKKKPSNKPHKTLLSLTIKPLSSHLCQLNIDIIPSVFKKIHEETIEQFKQKKIEGFHGNKAPSEYIKSNFTNEINKTTQHYFLKHFIVDFLMRSITEKKLPLLNYPRLHSIEQTTNKTPTFIFEGSLVDPIKLKEWKHFSFRPPRRKRYKDLDTQVTNFMQQQVISTKKQQSHLVEDNDWIFFSTQLLNNQNKVVDQSLTSSFWVKIKNQNLHDPFSSNFLNKRLHDSFITNQIFTNNETNRDDETHYNFLVKITGIAKGNNLILDHVKAMFKLKNKTDIHKKLIEVFSYKNDQSQRRLIIDDLFHLLLSKHRFEIPKHLIIRRQEDLLVILSESLDFQIYKAQENFEGNIISLAENQLREEALIDQIAYQENIKIGMDDIQHYFHILSNKRLREFIHFKPLLENIEAANTLINPGFLSRTVMREKTLNYIIHTLTN